MSARRPWLISSVHPAERTFGSRTQGDPNGYSVNAVEYAGGTGKARPWPIFRVARKTGPLISQISTILSNVTLPQTLSLGQLVPHRVNPAAIRASEAHPLSEFLRPLPRRVKHPQDFHRLTAHPVGHMYGVPATTSSRVPATC